jgi:hypothetical protein
MSGWSEPAGRVAATPVADPHAALLLLIYQSVEAPDLLPAALSALASLAGAESARIVRTSASEEQLVASGSARQWEGAHHGMERRRDAAAVGLRILPLSGDCELILEGSDPSSERLAEVVRVAPHLARALKLLDRLALRVSDPFSRPERLDLLPFGLLLLDRTKRAILVNRAAGALLRPRAPLELCDGHLTPRAAVSRALLDTILEQAVAPTRERQRRALGGRMSLAAPVQRPIELVVAPFVARCDAGESACAVLLFSPSLGVADPEALFVRRFRLTSGEAAAAARLLAGRSPLPPYAGGDLEAARRSVHALFGKLGTTRQSDLLRMLVELPEPREAGPTSSP